MRRLRKITAAERKIMPRSRNVPKKTDFIISRQPLWPRLKCNSRGHHSDTGEGVRIASATTWEKTKRKQSTGLIFGILDQHLQPLEAIKAITTANKRLWVGPRWKKLPLPWTTSPIKTSMSGKLVRTTTHPRTLQKLPFLFDFSQRSWMARPTAVCPRGKGMEEHLTILDLWLQFADFRFRIWLTITVPLPVLSENDLWLQLHRLLLDQECKQDFWEFTACKWEKKCYLWRFFCHRQPII